MPLRFLRNLEVVARGIALSFRRAVVGGDVAEPLLDRLLMDSGRPFMRDAGLIVASSSRRCASRSRSWAGAACSVKNLAAAGGGRMRRHGKTFGIADPQVVTRDEAAAYVNRRARTVFARLPFEQAVLLTRTA